MAFSSDLGERQYAGLPMSKRCSGPCGMMLSRERFYATARGKVRKDGSRTRALSSQCRDCTREDSKRRHRENAAIVAAIKVEMGCTDCGYRAHSAALEFDHLPGETKLFDISSGITSKGIKTIMAEIAKCEVVCANCHAIRTVNRLLEVSA